MVKKMSSTTCVFLNISYVNTKLSEIASFDFTTFEPLKALFSPLIYLRLTVIWIELFLLTQWTLFYFPNF